MPEIKKVLIANRGEIALRILRACREMEIETVAIYSALDRKELHVRFADEAYLIEGTTPLSCYLDGPQILAIAQKAGCDAIHPGYGFLSENSKFVRTVEESGIIFIGPTSDSMALMGDKVEARRTMQKSGVPVIPGTIEPVKEEELMEVAKTVGFPLMLKAKSGGGGKGIRIVQKEEDLIPSFQRASSEAQTAFGSGALYVEKVILKPRHVEVQILGDGEGKAVAIGERDCSLQRRHQKMVEECPCAFIRELTRSALHEAGVKAAEAVKYRGAGTVEFLVDSDENFYFLEMNTRLQVEHPITELVYGIDLVRSQINIARGHLELPRNPKPKGHAIEVRILAEDSYHKFLPSTGTVSSLHLPGGPGVRLDSALYEGQKITPYYDPLLAKLIVYGDNRQQALQRALGALQEFEIQGLSTNIPYVHALLEDERVAKGKYYTRFLEEEYSPTPSPLNRELAALALALYKHLEGEPVVEKESSGAQMNYWKFFGRVDLLRKHS